MKQIYRVIFPTDKIYIGIDASGHPLTIDVDNSELLEADFAALPKAQQADYSLQKTILWESETCSDELLSQKQREFIRQYQADNPTIGYNTLSDTAFTPSGAESWSVGVDGCKAGWFFVASHAQHFKIGVVRHIEELFSLFAPIRAVTIDIPIGLHNEGSAPRQCDVLARQRLKPRGSTVFPAPVRPCLTAKDYQHACDISAKLTGKKLSKQAYNIFDKIKEVDDLLSHQPSKAAIIHEAHPELGFCMINNGKPLLTSKKEQDGLVERLSMLATRLPNAEGIYQQALDQFPRKILARDDIVDAMMCLCIAQSPDSQQLPAQTHRDPTGLIMAMRYTR